MNKTTKYNNMISAFQCDFSLARDGYLKLAEIDYILDKSEGEELRNDIELLEELEMGLRYGKLAIIEVDDTLEEQKK